MRHEQDVSEESMLPVEDKWALFFISPLLPDIIQTSSPTPSEVKQKPIVSKWRPGCVRIFMACQVMRAATAADPRGSGALMPKAQSELGTGLKVNEQTEPRARPMAAKTCSLDFPVREGRAKETKQSSRGEQKE